MVGAPQERLGAARVRTGDHSASPALSPAAAREAEETEHSSILGEVALVGETGLADRVGAFLVPDCRM